MHSCAVKQCLFSFILTCYYLGYSQAQDCANGDSNGDGNPSASNNNIGGETDTYFLLCGSSNDRYVIDCCGVLDEFEYYSRTAATISLMMWRPNGAVYDLVTSVSHTTTGGEKRATVPGNVIVKPGDCFGWHAAGTEMIPYRSEGGLSASYLPAASVNPAGPQDWSSATSVTNRRYAIRALFRKPNDPTFSTAAATVTIPDTTGLGSLVHSVTFSDADTGDTHTLAMTPNGYFNFTDNGDRTGTVRTSSSTSVAGMSGQTVTLTFTVTDLCGATDTVTLTIIVTNDPPVITGVPLTVSLSEDITAETLVTSFTCTDLSDTVRASHTVTPATTDLFLQLDSGVANNAVFGLYAIAGSNFDYNVQRTYTVTFTCTDSKDTVTDGTTINLQQNQAPQITNLPSGTSITTSQSSTNGDVIFTVLHSDVESDPVTFSHTCSPVGCPFDVLDSGEVQVTQDLSQIATRGYDVTITVSDQKNSGTPRILSIVITDGPVFTNLPSSQLVAENTAAGSSLYQVSYTNTDFNGAQTFSMASSQLFEINPTTGVVSTKVTLNYEDLTTYSYSLPISLSDGNVNISNTLVITVTDVNEALTWNSQVYRVNVDEGKTVGSIIPNPGFAVTDPDAGDTFTCVMDCGTENGYFAMSTSCTLTVAANYRLDEGRANEITCTVTATDKGGNRDTTSLIIDIDEVNNYTPAFSGSNYGFTVSSYSGPNTVVGTVTATDLDIGLFGTFSYSLDQTGIAGNFFKIDGSTGVVSTQVDVQAECACPRTTQTIRALATDNGGLVGTSTVYITVGDYTTTTATTTTNRMKTFFEDSRNIGWFATAMALLVIAMATTVYVVMKYLCQGPPICARKLYVIRPFSSNYYRKPLVNRQDQVEAISHRRPPPPRSFQPWRNSEF